MQGAMAILSQRLGDPKDTGLLEFIPQTCDLVLKGTSLKAGNVGSVIIGFSPVHLAAIRKFDVQIVVGQVPNPKPIVQQLVQAIGAHTLVVTPVPLDTIRGAHLLYAPRHLLHAASATYVYPSIAIALSEEDKSTAISDIIHIAGTNIEVTAQKVLEILHEEGK